MDEIIEFFKILINPESIIRYGGLALLIFVIFAETGLFFGFFLPGDSLLFIAGLLCATSEQARLEGDLAHNLIEASIYTILITVSIAGILGNFVGYWFGRRTGPLLFRREDSLLFKKHYVESARDFYHKYGGIALVLGRFLPIIRTFVPIFAGVVGVDYKKFVLFNIIGSVLWVFSMTLIGYFLGRTVPEVKEYLEYIVIGIIFVSTIPVIKAFFTRQIHKRRERKTAAS